MRSIWWRKYKDVGDVANAKTAASFKITDEKLYVPIVTLSTEDSVRPSKLLSEGFCLLEQIQDNPKQK